MLGGADGQLTVPAAFNCSSELAIVWERRVCVCVWGTVDGAFGEMK